MGGLLASSCDFCPVEVRGHGAAGQAIRLDDPAVFKVKVDEIERELRAVRDQYQRVQQDYSSLQESHGSALKERDLLRVRYHEALAKLEHLGNTYSHAVGGSMSGGGPSVGSVMASQHR